MIDQFSENHLLKVSLLKFILFGSLLKINCPYVWSSVFGLSVLFHLSEDLFLVSYIFINMSLSYSLGKYWKLLEDMGILMYTNIAAFLSMCLKYHWYFCNYCISSENDLSRIVILTILIFSIYNKEVFYFLMTLTEGSSAKII